MDRDRGKAYTGKGYGSLRFRLFIEANHHIQRCLRLGYFCEATTVIESVIADRLESRVSFLIQEDFGFKTLGELVRKAKQVETDPVIRVLVEEVDQWRVRRNHAVHELVKIEDGQPLIEWRDRLKHTEQTAVDGYEILKALYWRIADLNPHHLDRVFPKPKRDWSTAGR